jgi:hypothetical protein
MREKEKRNKKKERNESGIWKQTIQFQLKQRERGSFGVH